MSKPKPPIMVRMTAPLQARQVSATSAALSSNNHNNLIRPMSKNTPPFGRIVPYLDNDALLPHLDVMILQMVGTIHYQVGPSPALTFMPERHALAYPVSVLDGYEADDAGG